MKLASILALCAAVTAALLADEPAPAPAAAPATPAAETLATALTRATTEKRQLLLEFFSYLTVESKMLRDQTLSNPLVKDIIADKFIVLRVELEREPALAAQHHVTRAPTVVLLTPDGKEIDRISGVLRAPEFRRILEAAATGKTEFAQLREKAAAPDANAAQRAELATAYLRRGQVAEAVATYAQAIDAIGQSRDDIRFAGTLVNRLVPLAKHPAAKPLIADLAERWGQEGVVGNAEKLRAAIALNNALGLAERNVALFLRIPEKDSRREQLFPSILPQLVEGKHYAEAAAATDLEAFTSRFYGRLEPGHVHGGKADATHGHDAVEIQEKRLIGVVAPCVEALLGVGETRKAQRIAGRAMENVHEGDLRVRLVESAQRVNSPSGQAFLLWLDQEYPVKKSG